LLFLAAGIVIHALAGEQDMRKMGGLRRFLPRTYWAFLVGALALTGIPPLSGFFSKDAILASTLAREDWWGYLLFSIGIVGALLTGIYTFRMLFMVFGGEPSAFVREHFHALKKDLVGISMGVPVAVLTVLATFGGWIQFAPFWTPISNFLEPVAPPLVDATGTQELVSSVCGVAAGALGIWIAWLLYSRRSVEVPRYAFVQTTLEHKFYFDELYDLVFYKPSVALARSLAWFVEAPILASVGEFASWVRRLGTDTSRVQTGLVRLYALAIAAGAAVMAIVFVAVR
jgi:NADH-quinone oxidoreductase subunit L